MMEIVSFKKNLNRSQYLIGYPTCSLEQGYLGVSIAIYLDQIVANTVIPSYCEW